MNSLECSSPITEIRKFCTVSDEAAERLEAFATLLEKWNKKINLIGKDTDIWGRHILDSAQVIKFIPSNASILTDFGSGAGFPGLILAILGNFAEVHLIESNGKKTAFLSEAARITNTQIHIHNDRIESLIPWRSDIITARAFADIDKTLRFITPFLAKDGLCLLPKGYKARSEIEKARKNWTFECELHSSITCDNSFIAALTKVIPNGTVAI